MLVKVSVVFMFCLIFSKNVNVESHERIECEPQQFQSENRWTHRYNMTVTKTKFIRHVVALSKHTMPHLPLGILETEMGAPEAIFYAEVLNIKKAGKLQGFRANDQIIIWHFLHGDSIIFHTLDPETKEYAKTEIGFHTRKYYFVTKPGVWHALDFPLHFKVKSTLVGLTLVRGDARDSDRLYPSREKLLKDFPHHVDIINNVYDRAFHL